MSKKIKSCIWLAVGLLAMVGFASRVQWGEFKVAISDISWPGITVAILMVLCAQSIMAARWLILLRVHAIHISFYQAVKLTYLGLFYNNMMPGAVGGDLLKGWFITHHCDKSKQLNAMTTVFVDRLTGLISMICVGAIASLFAGRELRIGFGFRVRDVILGILGGFALAAGVFLSRRARKALMLSHILGRLPFSRQLRKVDSAIRLYRHHIPTMIGAMLITVVTQGLVIAAVWVVSQSLRLDNVGFLQCLMIMPIIWLISAAIPVPGGLGVMEYLFIPFFAQAIDPVGAIPGATAVAQAATLALLNRMMICVCSCPGALVPVFGGHLPRTGETVGADQVLAFSEVNEGSG